MSTTPNRNLLPDSSVCRELDISQRTLQRHLREGRIDAPMGKLGKNRRGWTRPEIELIREQLAQREKREGQPA
jgi:predicted site-specific integrase-resolvase